MTLGILDRNYFFSFSILFALYNCDLTLNIQAVLGYDLQKFFVIL